MAKLQRWGGWAQAAPAPGAGVPQHGPALGPKDGSTDPTAGGGGDRALDQDHEAWPLLRALRSRPSVLVGRHSKGTGAADAGGSRVLGPTAHRAGPTALTVVALGVVLAALRRKGQVSASRGEGWACFPPAGPNSPTPSCQRPGDQGRWCPTQRSSLPQASSPKGPWISLVQARGACPTSAGAPLTTQTPEPGRQRSEWLWH